MTTTAVDDPARRREPGAHGRTLRGHACTAVVVTVLLVVAGAVGWRVTGGRWAIIETASMGQAVPVGSLIVTRPSPVDRLEVGDIVTYRPPGLRTLYTHRVVELTGDATVRVQGDSNGGRDPWPVDQQMLVGQVVGHWRGLGWLVRALPMLILAFAVLGAATRRYVPLQWRSSARVLGTCLVLGGTSLLLRPFVHPVLVNTFAGTDGAGGDVLRATVVSTGLFPTRITGADGDHVDLLSGQLGSVLVDPPTAGGPLLINGTAHLTGWWLVGVAAVSLLPLLWVLVVGLAPAPDPLLTPDQAQQAQAREENTAELGARAHPGGEVGVVTVRARCVWP